ncbi:transmembrane 6 superfamily member 2 [Eublepharis macularius]|uniref:Transmembrane 6 superfamily member 2 n=1 Tax=Eublepharis macularius TaxID=481883 RepID=A0AA97L0K3_EUBMA|nr:transmembrane 6 superfamily member 2 [Eublepharis macularius]
MRLPPVWAAVALSLFAFPVSYTLNSLSALEHSWAVAAVGAVIPLGLLALVYLPSQSQDPLFYVFMVFSFTSVIDTIIALEEDGYIGGFMEFYMNEGEPYLRTAYGLMICYWDGVVHYALYLVMIAALSQRKSYRNFGLYWIGSLTMSLVVFLLGNIVGKYGSEIRPAFLLNFPYLLIPIWAAKKIFSQPKTLPLLMVDKISEEQNKNLLQRPLDLGLVVFLLLAAVFTLFRGLIVLDCSADACFDYVYQHEPYLRDPVAYPKVQMLVFLFYLLPYFCLCLYGLLCPGCTWMPDWALVFAGAMAQAQFSHIGSSLHHHTPYPYRTPEAAWWPVVFSNVAYAAGLHLLAYRCLRNPVFFFPVAPRDEDKKKQ